MANERIKAEAKATKEDVAKVVKTAIQIQGEKSSKKIYVGPNLLGLIKYTVVESIEIPHVQAIVKECPEVEKLFVAIENMAETEARIKEKGTLEHRYFNKVAEFKAGKGVK